MHDFGTLWKHRQFLISAGKPASYKLVPELLNATQLPKQIAVCKCKTHTNNTDPVSQGNERADAAAKAAAKEEVIPQCVSVPDSHGLDHVSKGFANFSQKFV